MASRLALPVAFVLLMAAMLGMVRAESPEQRAPIVTPATFEELVRGTAKYVPTPSPTPNSSPAVGVAAGEPTPEPPVAAPTTREEPFELWLAESPWPRELWGDVTEIAYCESRHLPHVIGDGGLAYGLLQIREDYWPRLVRSFDLLDPRDNLAAGWVVFLEAGRSFAPWSCWEG